MYSIGEFAKKLGVSQNTLRNWEQKGKIVPLRTPGNKRRYTDEMLNEFLGIKRNRIEDIEKEIILYARVSSSGQKNDLENQKKYLMDFAVARGYTISDLYTDIGSAMNYKRKHFLKLCDKVQNREVEKVVITNKDRLVRFGFDYFEGMFRKFGCEIVIIDKRENVTPEQELAEDLVNIVQHFSAKIYGKRTYKNRKMNNTVEKTLADLTKNEWKG